MTIHHTYNPKTRKIDFFNQAPSSYMMQNLKHVGEYNMWMEKELPHSVYLGFGMFHEDFVEELNNWIIKNLAGRWANRDAPFLQYHFETASDAVAFKLRWF